jgi:hypothetical protein
MRVTQSVLEIDLAVGECWDSDTGLVLLATGDGGLHRFLSSFVRVYGERRLPDGATKPLPLFATFRSGTANLVTGLLGCRGKPLEAVQRLFARVKQIAGPQELPRIRQRLMAISDGRDLRFGFMAGLGAVHNFFVEYYRGSRYSLTKFFNILAHALVSLFTSGSYLNRLFASMEARLQLDEKRQQLARWKMLAVSAIETRVVFFRAFRLDHLADRLHIKAGNPSRWDIIRNLPNVLFNRPLRGKNLLDRLIRQAQWERDADFGYTIDGELYRAQRLTFTPGPIVEFVRL